MGRLRRLYGISGRQAPAGFSLAYPLSEVLTESFLNTPSDGVAGAQTVALGLAVEVTSALPVTTLNNAIPAVIYDGAFDFLKHTGGPAGATDGTTGTFVWAGTFNSDGSAMTLIDIPGTVPVKLERKADNSLDFIVGTAGSVCANSTAAVASSLGFLIVLASFSGTTSHLYVVHAAGTITGVNTAGASATADLTADWFLGADGGASSFLDADTSMWWADDSFIDFSVSDNRDEFWDTTNDKLRDPGSDGSNPSPAQPLVCHVEASASHTTNRGTGGNADAGTNSGDGTSPGAFAADFTPVTLEITETDTNILTPNSSSHTHTSQSFGAADAGRYIVVETHTEHGLAVPSESGCTIGGVTATKVAEADTSTGNMVAIFVAAVPTGTSGDVAVSHSGTVFVNGIRVYRVLGISGVTASDTLEVTGTSLTGSVTVPAGGLLIAAAALTTNGDTPAWTGVTKTGDIYPESRMTASSGTSTSASGVTTVTCTQDTANADDCMAVVAWSAA